MVPATTNGAAQNKNVSTNNVENWYSLDFNDTTQQFAHAVLAMPSDWDAGTITAKFHWTANSTSTSGVVWALEGVSLGNDETIDAAYGTAQQIADSNTATALQLHISDATPAITIAGAGASDLVMYRVKRVPADGSDTLVGDAKLLGVVITFGRTVRTQ